ncbi:MAG: hypothetical protein ACI4B5_04445 [Bacteroidaceae bacterium]
MGPRLWHPSIDVANVAHPDFIRLVSETAPAVEETASLSPETGLDSDPRLTGRP